MIGDLTVFFFLSQMKWNHIRGKGYWEQAVFKAKNNALHGMALLISQKPFYMEMFSCDETA